MSHFEVVSRENNAIDSCNQRHPPKNNSGLGLCACYRRKERVNSIMGQTPSLKGQNFSYIYKQKAPKSEDLKAFW